MNQKPVFFLHSFRLKNCISYLEKWFKKMSEIRRKRRIQLASEPATRINLREKKYLPVEWTCQWYFAPARRDTIRLLPLLNREIEIIHTRDGWHSKIVPDVPVHSERNIPAWNMSDTPARSSSPVSDVPRRRLPPCIPQILFHFCPPSPFPDIYTFLI